jgi:PAS domain S-box-containing protein
MTRTVHDNGDADMVDPVNILLVDDHEANLLALEVILQPLGQNLVKARSGQEALRLLLDDDFAVVLLDIRLGSMDGFEVAQRIRTQERSQHAPIIFITAYESEDFPPAKAYTLGAVDYLIKPLVPEILRAKVAVFIDLFQNARLRQSERRLRALLENAWDGISLLSSDGTILENIPHNLHRLGYSQEEFLGHRGFEFIHSDDLPAVQAALEHLLQAAGAKAMLQYRLRRKDGSWCWVEGIGTNLLHDPAVRALVVNYRDISEQKAAEDELRRRAEELMEAHRQKDQFLVMLAHELRNPLAPLLTGLHILRQPQTSVETGEQTRAMMERQLRHVSHLVDDLLDVSRILRGKVQLRRERLDLAQLTRTAAEDRRAVLRQAGLDLRLDIQETPVWVIGDAARLTQILNNLLDNVVKFADGGDQVTVRATADVERRQAVLSVRDKGAGIEPELLPRLFSPFLQADRSLDRSRGGLGLGLALVKGLTELHGGCVEASSAGAGRGAEFTIRVPLEQEPDALTDKPTGPHAKGKHLRILVVEDNRDAADSLRMLLELLDHEVRTAYSGPDGVTTARQWRPDVVLCDIGLPGLDGYGVARELRLNPTTARVRLLALTGYGAEEDRRRSSEAGFDAHLVKPADPAELCKLLASG